MKTPPKAHAFSLVEILFVMGIAITLATLSTPALQSLKGAGSTNQAVGDLCGTLELARSYAMANHTYVRVGLYTLEASVARPVRTVVVVPVYSVDGSESAAMTTANWKALSRPVFLGNLALSGSLNAVAPDTSMDSDPFSAPSSFGALTMPIAGAGPVAFDNFIQFTPNGEACLEAGLPVRYIKLGMTPQTGKDGNPFLLRLSGINGTVSVLRKEDLQ